ncbi:MAG TPA: GTP-binding protein [Bryobacteraceae bacterium]|nr:GTP-binding protein [Bryobacteraceae bacterium]
MPHKGLLRFTTAGSVDDGKSTLIGRLLHDSGGVFEDQLASVRNSGLNRSAGPLDFSLITDGLKAEREQGITIDVAYRYFSTPSRNFIIADTPGHEQYTRNMATGASTADLAVILVDVAGGVTPQSRRHACIASLLGIPSVVVAVNKMDLAGCRHEAFDKVRRELEPHLERLGLREAQFIPVSALEGDNVVARSSRMPWYRGPSLLEHLEAAPAAVSVEDGPLRFPVQYVLRPDSSFRGYAGQIVSGRLRVGDPVMILPSGRTTRVRSLPAMGGDLAEARPPMSITVCLEHELDISRGDMLVDPRRLPHVARRFDARLVWMHAEPLRTNRPYLLKQTTQQVPATVTRMRHRLNVDTLEREEADRLEMNEIGGVTLETSRPVYFDAYGSIRSTGSFILIDPASNATVGAGMIEPPPRGGTAEQAVRAALGELEFRSSRLTPAERYSRAGHYPAVVWLSARKDLAYLLEVKLFARGCQVHVVSGETESTILPELAQLLEAAGLIAIFSVPAMDRGEIGRARELVAPGRWLEVAPDELSPSDEEAARQICDRLEAGGIIPAASNFRDGEGI